MSAPQDRHYRDFDVSVSVRFRVTIGAVSREQAELSAEVITRSVFRNDYERAERLDVSIEQVEER